MGKEEKWEKDDGLVLAIGEPVPFSEIRDSRGKYWVRERGVENSQDSVTFPNNKDMVVVEKMVRCPSSSKFNIFHKFHSMQVRYVFLQAYLPKL